ncbi:uncharacterized protein LOC134875264 isoform X2 [Eleginops maclovinus]|uniref:uncharacterized protein LOC134875264 isoform X2 n=1 Tax=Eleginops maclovinus TaxID=56733 RepID=UPI00307FD655
MRMNIGSLLALMLGCSAISALHQEVFEERTSGSLRCPHSVGGNVTWSKERNGNKVDILTIDGDRDIRHNDPDKRYSSVVDKSLYIQRLTLSDSGRYFCNDAAVELTVIPSATKAPPTPTTLTSTPLLSSTSRQTSEIVTPESSTSPPTTTDTTTTQEERKGRKEGNKKHKNKGNKKPKRTTTTTTTKTSTTTTVSSKDKPQILRLVLGTVVFFLLLIIVITFVAWRWRFKRLGNEETHPVYDEIQDGVIIQNTAGFGIVKGPTPAYCMTDFTDDPNLNEPTYSTIPDLPPVERRTDTLLPKESPYSLISYAVNTGNCGGNF